ncbi:MAG: hypothetical protein GY812_01895 [Actinomycetia bacterium]|nr:hypothetical protein [Actinomycetes bacterium]
MTSLPCSPNKILAIATVAASALLAACGGGSQMSRQDFVDNLESQGEGLINEAIASCMYDGLDDDPEAADAVGDWNEGDSVPPELLDLAVACLGDPPDTPGS